MRGALFALLSYNKNGYMKISFDHTKIIITRSRGKILKIAFVILAIIIVIFVFLTGLALANKNKLVYGLKLANISVGGLAIDEARIEIDKVVKEFLEKDIVLRHEDENEHKIWTVLPENLGIKINIDSTLEITLKIFTIFGMISKFLDIPKLLST